MISYFFFFLPMGTEPLRVEFLPLSVITRVGNGLPDGDTLNLTLSPLFGPCVMVFVNVEPVFLGLPALVFAIPPVFLVAMVTPVDLLSKGKD